MFLFSALAALRAQPRAPHRLRHTDASVIGRTASVVDMIASYIVLSRSKMTNDINLHRII